MGYRGKVSRKDLGAFYTPAPYAKKAAGLVKRAVDRVPIDNDYIILDRCAGEGSLEEALIDLKDRNGSPLISHCVISTYEYNEYKVLVEKFSGKVRAILSDGVDSADKERGVIGTADALSEGYINNSLLQRYINDPKCTIILYENPPYHNVYDNTAGTGVVNCQQSFIYYEMQKAVQKDKKHSYSDIVNQFIWSGFHHYVRYPTDSYVLISPIKPWKSLNLIKNSCAKMYLFRRKHFGATDAALCCGLWTGVKTSKQYIAAEAIDIINGECVVQATVDLYKVRGTLSELVSKSSREDDEPSTFRLGRDGYIHTKPYKAEGKNIYNKDIVGYMRVYDYAISAINQFLLRHTYYRARGYYLRRENYRDMLPLWVAKLYPCENWWEKDILYNSSDKCGEYKVDPEFIRYCFIYVCLSQYNRCISFIDADGRTYQNELCFDGIGGIVNGKLEPIEIMDNLPLAVLDIYKYEGSDWLHPDAEEYDLLALWHRIMELAKTTKNYNSDYRYGAYQIERELSTHTHGKQVVYDYPELQEALNLLKLKLKDYYRTHIQEKMLRYALVK